MNLINVIGWSEAGEASPVYPGTECIFPGCQLQRARPGGGGCGGAGYCPRHARNFYRYGDPEGVRAMRLRGMLDAALAYGGDPGRDELDELGRAAAAYAIVRLAPRYRPGQEGRAVELAPGKLDAPEGLELARAARVLWAVPGTEEADAFFPTAMAELERWAGRFLAVLGLELAAGWTGAGLAAAKAKRAATRAGQRSELDRKQAKSARERARYAERKAAGKVAT